MSRGGRRGQLSSTTLMGLKDTVRKKLFDPNALPAQPDLPSLLTRLKPVTLGNLTLKSALKLAAESTTSNMKQEEGATLVDGKAAKAAGSKPGTPASNADFLTGVFQTDCVLRYAFQNGLDHHRLRDREQGIPNKRSCNSDEAIVVAVDNLCPLHLLLDHENLKNFGDKNHFIGRHNPACWYPRELVERLRSKPKLKKTQSVVASTGKKRAAEKDTASKQPAPAGDRLSNRAQLDEEEENPDNAIERAEQQLAVDEAPEEEDDDDDLEVNKSSKSRQIMESDEEEDPEDARWNGKKKKSTAEGKADVTDNPAELEEDDEDDDEEENDYCDNYFDNGEGDDGMDVRMDDGEGDVEDYYD